jgi:hypothetical protein
MKSTPTTMRAIAMAPEDDGLPFMATDIAGFSLRFDCDLC